MFFSFPYFTPKLFCFFRIRLLVCPCAFSSFLFEFFFSLFWNAIFWLHCLTQSQYLLSLPSCTSFFWFISSSCIIRFVCYFVFAFSSQLIPFACFFPFLSVFTCSRNFFTCSSSLNSHPGFVFLIKFFRGKPILSV